MEYLLNKCIVASERVLLIGNLCHSQDASFKPHEVYYPYTENSLLSPLPEAY